MEQKQLPNALDLLNAQWSRDFAEVQKNLSLCLAENVRLQQENEELKKELDEIKKPQKKAKPKGE